MKEKVLNRLLTVKSIVTLSLTAVFAFIPNECVENRPGIRFIPLRNWHQALYMCILYDKWLDQPVWDFVEIVVKAFRKKNQ